jgi:hypothetical protein
MSVAALIISVIALLVSAGQWILNGPWIVISSRSGIVVDQPDHPECLVLIANNRGRLPATIHQWGWLIKGTLHGPAAWSLGPSLPHRLEGHDEARWMLDYKEAQGWLAQNFPTTRHYWDLVPFVRLGMRSRFIKGRRSVLRIWEVGQFGPDPATSQWWKRFSPWHTPAQGRHGTGWMRKQRLP